jgi:hypothetical protein
MTSRAFKAVMVLAAVWAVLTVPSILVTIRLEGTWTSWPAVLAAGYLLLPIAVVLLRRGRRSGVAICALGGLMAFGFGIHRSFVSGLELSALHVIVLGLFALDRIVTMRQRSNHGLAGTPRPGGGVAPQP